MSSDTQFGLALSPWFGKRAGLFAIGRWLAQALDLTCDLRAGLAGARTRARVGNNSSPVRFLAVLFGGLAVAGVLASGAAPSDETILPFLTRRVQNDPLDFVAHNRLSGIYISLMRQTGDLAYLDRALQSARASLAAIPGPRNAAGLTALAVSEFESHHFREALSLAEQARSIDASLSLALATAGDAQLELGNYDQAAKVYEQLAASESGAPVQARLARLAELKGDNQKALELLTQAVAQSPDRDAAWYRTRLGELHFRSGDLNNAEAQYEAARQLRPNSFLVLEHLAELRAAQGHIDQAIELYQKVIERTPRGEFYQALGDLYLFAGKNAEAKKPHARALQAYLESVAQGNAHYYHHLAGFYADAQELPAEAVRWANKDLEVRQSIYAHDALAWALYKNGQFAEAAKEADRALALGTKDAHLLYHAAMVYSRAGDLQRGSALLKEALAVNPRYNSFHAHR